MTCSVSDPFCDYLRVSYAPERSPASELVEVVSGLGGYCESSGNGVTSYRVGDGLLRCEVRRKWELLSLSGGVLQLLRTVGQFNDVLALLASEPYRVTRLDAALDLPQDGADVVASLRRQYPRECSLSRKSLPVTSLLGSRMDGRESGTFYVGHRTRARATARVYDKTLEAWVKRREVLPPTVRYEVTAGREFGATLRDASMPSSLFWHIASPSLLQAPPGVEPWSAREFEGWEAHVPDRTPAELLGLRVGNSPDLASMIDLADSLGASGRPHLLRLLARRLALEDRLC